MTDAFAKAGLTQGDAVLVGVCNCPDAVATLLALNKIGVVSKWFDVRAGEKDIEDYANDSNCRYLIAFDMLLPKIQRGLDNTNLEKVLIIYPTDSLSVVMQTVYSIKVNRLPKDSRYMRMKKFVKSGNVNSLIPCVPFDKERPSIIIQSSGTTGKPKIIVHSDFSATSCVKNYHSWISRPKAENTIGCASALDCLCIGASGSLSAFVGCKSKTLSHL